MVRTEPTPELTKEPTPGRFSLGSLMCLMTSCCVVFVAASWIPQGLAVIVPPMLGPLTAWSILPTTRSTIWGLASAYFWTVAGVMAFAGLFAIASLGQGHPASYAIALVASFASVFGGFLGAIVEKSRLQHLEKRRLREERWGEQGSSELPFRKGDQ